MHVRTIGLGAVLALAADAVLMPPGVSSKHNNHEAGLRPLAFVPEKTFVQFECANCPYARFDGKFRWATKGQPKNSLIYEFDVGRDHDRLLLNGVQLFPPYFGEPQPLYIHQLPSRVSTDKMDTFLVAHPKRKALPVTQMEFAFNSAETISEDGNELLSMHLKISGLAGKDIPAQLLRIFLMKDVTGRLSIASIQGTNNPTEIKAEEAKECESWPLLCQWRQVLADKFSSLKGSMTKKPSKGCDKTHPAGGRIDNRPHHRPRPHGNPPHPPRPQNGHHPHHHPHGASHHHHHGKVAHMIHHFARAVLHILVPVFIGIAAGVTTYMAGMAIGMTAAIIWVKIRGTRAEQYDPVAQDEEDVDDEANSGKEVYLKVEEYESVEVEMEAPPVYEEVAEKEVVN